MAAAAVTLLAVTAGCDTGPDQDVVAACQQYRIARDNMLANALGGSRGAATQYAAQESDFDRFYELAARTDDEFATAARRARFASAANERIVRTTPGWERDPDASAKVQANLETSWAAQDILHARCDAAGVPTRTGPEDLPGVDAAGDR